MLSTLVKNTTPAESLYYASFVYGLSHVSPRSFVCDPLGACTAGLLTAVLSSAFSSLIFECFCPPQLLIFPTVCFALGSVRNVLYGSKDTAVVRVLVAVQDAQKREEERKEAKRAKKAQKESNEENRAVESK